MDDDFDPLALKPEERKLYHYAGPEIIYTFWAKHGPCQVTGCGHRTPIMTSPVIAVKTISIKAWGDRACPKCKNASIWNQTVTHGPRRTIGFSG